MKPEPPVTNTSLIRATLPADSLLTGKITGKLRDLVRFRASRNKKTPAPQRFLEKCRENPAGKVWTDNREDIGQNRENAGILVSVHFLHACVLAVRRRSVLADKFSGGGRDGVSSGALRRGVLAGAS